MELVIGLCLYIVFEFEGCDIYICEGCVGCYSQMICLFCVEIECYGYYSVVGELVWEYFFFWGFKCIGFDLVCVGGCYSDEWY